MVTTNMLLSVLFVSGVWAACNKQPSLFITTPKNMEAMSGSCLQIPCNFSVKLGKEFDNGGKIFGLWIKEDSRFHKDSNNVIFNSSRIHNKYPMKFTGNLSEKKCTTLFSSLLQAYSNKYFLRIEHSTFMATASCDPLQITVQDSPPSPRIEILGDLKEKESVTITCSAVTPCPLLPPQLTWSLQKDSHNKMEENINGIFTTNIQKTLTLSDKHDGLNITCCVQYPVNEGKDYKRAVETRKLNVSHAPKDTSVSASPSDFVSAGGWVNLSCSSRAKPPVSKFTWFKKSEGRDMKVSEGGVYSVNGTDGGVYYCVASNALGKQASSVIHLTNEGHLHSSWGAIAGGITGTIVLISVVIAILWCKSRHVTSQQTQVLTGGEPAVQEPDRTTQSENLHYGEINFSSCRHEPTSVLTQYSRQQQDILYAQVKVYKTGNGSTQTPYSPECIYSQVTTK